MSAVEMSQMKHKIHVYNQSSCDIFCQKNHDYLYGQTTLKWVTTRQLSNEATPRR